MNITSTAIIRSLVIAALAGVVPAATATTSAEAAPLLRHHLGFARQELSTLVPALRSRTSARDATPASTGWSST